MQKIYFLLLSFLILALSSCSNLISILIKSNPSNSKLNPSPIIGVFAQPSDFNETYPTNSFSYIASSYIKFVEQAGARVVPIPYNLPKSELKRLFQSVNGLLFPGGDASLFTNDTERLELSNMTLAGQYLLNLSIEANSHGDYFPVWGTCLGYELIMIAISNANILEKFNSTNHRVPLIYRHKSRIFEDLSPKLKKYTEENDAFYFNHRYGMTVEGILANQKLNSTFFISSVSKTDNGTIFVSSVEGRNLPIYGIQFHPEKNPFEWRKEINATHSKENIELTQFIGDFFVEEARKNFHRFENEQEEEKSLIYNYTPVKVNKSFMECYFFKNK